MWSYIKSKKQGHTGIASLNHQNTTVPHPLGKANVLVDYFSSVFTQDNSTSSLPDLNVSPLPVNSPVTIHSKGVAIQPHKASGPDNLPTHFLKEVAIQISPVLSTIFQASLDQGHVLDI